ncbi:efflux RND transporter periplasmic adaptor subunit [Lignipirellula cremea]|uniref:efflux RND transporter periplasmic adaptor subunit n=1 Tax=Lignipirellula cremea TaxID=2528010 RepID=UPI0018D22C40|nr:efflux RND transporter periplasmic adaptor subunit [Lignipirellula cremea]
MQELPGLRRLQREMLQLTTEARAQLDLVQGLLKILDGCAAPLAAFYFQRNAQGELAVVNRLRPTEEDRQSQRLARQLLAACQAACRAGEMEMRQQAAPARLLLAAPVFLCGPDPEGLGLVFAADQPPAQAALLTQMFASHLVLWHLLAGNRGSLTESRSAAAVVELQSRLLTAPDLRQACYTLAGELQTFLNCQRVAVGMRAPGGGRCRLIAVSQMAQFDSRSPTAQAMESAMDEAVLRQEATRWPPADEQQRHGALAHKKLSTLEEQQSVLSVPLIDDDQQAVGVLLILEKPTVTLDTAERFLLAAARPLAVSLAAVQRFVGGPFTRLRRASGKVVRTGKGKIALAGTLLLLGAMLLPLPHRVHCDCQLEPVTRRFVAAPFEGALEESLVKPGDLVRQGQLLARLDGRELRWKRASVSADHSQATKKRDAAQASRNYADQQIASLEIERLELELQLLDHRTANLEIRSPLDGIVASGDLERAEGAPLTMGQSLFEIAPLETMIVEVAIPDDQIASVIEGQPLDIRLDSYPGQSWRGETGRIHPRSEIRDDENVFIAETELDNSDGRLRPGMKGRARVQAGLQPLGWILFHKPWEYLVKKAAW